MRTFPLLFLLAAGCAAPTFDAPADVATYCADRSVQTFDTTITIPAATAGCAWDSGDNVSEEQGVYTARVESFEAIPDLADATICALDFDFSRGFEFDDDVFLTWNRAVLLTNQGGVLENLSSWERYPLWHWDDLVEFAFPFQSESFCAGADEGLAECEIPRVTGGGGGSWTGDLSYEPDAAVVHELAWRSIQLGGPELGVAITGDNDATDCTHTELEVHLTGAAAFH